MLSKYEWDKLERKNGEKLVNIETELVERAPLIGLEKCILYNNMAFYWENMYSKQKLQVNCKS